jgi:PAS domain-containing protein
MQVAAIAPLVFFGPTHNIMIRGHGNRSGGAMKRLLSVLDLEEVFDNLPAACLVLDPAFKIVAQNLAHAQATITEPKNTLGRLLFEVFPDNPNDSNADGLSDLRASLTRVLKTRQADIMPVLKYAVKRRHSDGTYEDRYWRVTNTPVLGPDGFVRLIINVAEDVTALVEGHH